ncbi:hypothetical protein BAD_0896 [Bifidobacterium adolescentis ATCC 15703]|uniref:GNAT family N-acetyltransferase n=1 Tax=Bifidobacterium adolescentis (strain ATCC 15703 / DSM 20083 / NCTC 11814 / E194a) TaxID=367928 RepID=A1A1U4_BIFAA|nr:hypothetical protein BAD_0896 [Bifidobacterium adolescentis ATCC 15703]SPU23922.1 Uncharacterised protein [Bifidobacterium adolescentis]
MEYIRITRDNIDAEHVCCAMSGKQALAKKEWLKRRFDEGLIFYRSVERGKCFIEYIPAENAWVPIQADGYLYIDCLWVAGSMKGHGYSNDLLRGVREGCEGAGAEGIVYFVCRRTQARIPLRREIPCAQGFHGCGHVIMRNHAHVPAVRFGHGASAIQRMRQISHGGW